MKTRPKIDLFIEEIQEEVKKKYGQSFYGKPITIRVYRIGGFFDRIGITLTIDPTYQLKKHVLFSDYDVYTNRVVDIIMKQIQTGLLELLQYAEEKEADSIVDKKDAE